jgi:hypothetical protein
MRSDELGLHFTLFGEKYARFSTFIDEETGYARAERVRDIPPPGKEVTVKDLVCGLDYFEVMTSPEYRFGYSPGFSLENEEEIYRAS